MFVLYKYHDNELLEYKFQSLLNDSKIYNEQRQNEFYIFAYLKKKTSFKYRNWKKYSNIDIHCTTVLVNLYICHLQAKNISVDIMSTLYSNRFALPCFTINKVHVFCAVHTLVIGTFLVGSTM